MSALTAGARTTITSTIGTSAATVLAANSSRSYLRVHNPSKTAQLAVTYDGVTTPVVNGAGVTIAPLWEDENAVHVPIGAVQIIADANASPYTIEYQ